MGLIMHAAWVRMLATSPKCVSTPWSGRKNQELLTERNKSCSNVAWETKTPSYSSITLSKWLEKNLISFQKLFLCRVLSLHFDIGIAIVCWKIFPRPLQSWRSRETIKGIVTIAIILDSWAPSCGGQYSPKCPNFFPFPLVPGVPTCS